MAAQEPVELLEWVQIPLGTQQYGSSHYNDFTR